MSLIENVIKPLSKSVSIPLGLTAAASATGAAIHKRMFGPGVTTLIISNEEMNDAMKTGKSVEESGLLIKNISKTIQNEAKEQKGGIRVIPLSTLGASLLGNLLTGASPMKAGEGTVIVGHHF